MFKNLIEAKERELANLTKESVDALDIVTKTIDNLENINAKIGTAMAEIDGYQRRLAETRGGMETAQGKNAAIVGNFRKLLEV